MIVAAILGDTLNYWIGYRVGPKVFTRENSRWLNRQHLERTHQFYEKYGGKTIIIARFMPIIRNLRPVCRRHRAHGTMGSSCSTTCVGGVLWIVISSWSPAIFFGNIPVVRRNFTLRHLWHHRRLGDCRR
jgi:membrane-associated protein